MRKVVPLVVVWQSRTCRCLTPPQEPLDCHSFTAAIAYILRHVNPPGSACMYIPWE